MIIGEVRGEVERSITFEGPMSIRRTLKRRDCKDQAPTSSRDALMHGMQTKIRPRVPFVRARRGDRSRSGACPFVRSLDIHKEVILVVVAGGARTYF